MIQIKLGIVLSYLSILIVNIAGLITTPIIVRTLGDKQYGLYVLISSLVTYLMLFEGGMANTINRFVAKYRALNSYENEILFLKIIFKIILVIILLILFFSMGLVENISFFFKEENAILATQLIPIIIVSIIFNVLTSFVNGYLAAYEKFIFVKSLIIIKNLIRVLILFFVFSKIGDIAFLVWMDCFISIFVFFVSIIYFFKLFKLNQLENKFRILKENNNRMMKEVLSYAIWIFIFNLIAQIQWHSGQIIIGYKLDTSHVAIYSIGIILGTYYSAFADSINNVFMARTANIIYGKEGYQDLTEYMIKIGRLCLYILFLILGGFIVFGKSFIFLWIGEVYSDSWYIALLIMLIYTLPLSQGIANQVMEVKQMFYFKSIVYLLSITLGVFLGVVLLRHYNILGMIVGICSGWVLALILLNIYYQKKLNLNMLHFFFSLKNIFLVFLVNVSISIYFFPTFSDWKSLAVGISLYALFYFIFMYVFALNKEEKRILNNILFNLIKKY